MGMNGSRLGMMPDAMRIALARTCLEKWRDPKRKVYFIGADDGGPVKIGYSNNPRRRLAMLRCETGRNLRILAQVVGGADIEDGYHIMFDPQRLHGEWFEQSPELAAEIARIEQLYKTKRPRPSGVGRGPTTCRRRA